MTVFTFVAMSNAVNLTDGLDGLAAGTCAAAFLGMGVAVMPVYPGEHSTFVDFLLRTQIEVNALTFWTDSGIPVVRVQLWVFSVPP